MINSKKLKILKTSKRATTQAAINSRILTIIGTTRAIPEPGQEAKGAERIISIMGKPGLTINLTPSRRVSEKKEITISGKSSFLKEKQAMNLKLQIKSQRKKDLSTRKESL